MILAPFFSWASTHRVRILSSSSVKGVRPPFAGRDAMVADALAEADEAADREVLASFDDVIFSIRYTSLSSGSSCFFKASWMKSHEYEFAGALFHLA